METLSQCLYAWMDDEDLTVAQLTERLGYKSKTSVFRLLHGQSNYRSCAQICDLLMPDLDRIWKDRFRQALRVEKVGPRRYAMFQALDRCLFPEKGQALPLPDENELYGVNTDHKTNVVLLGDLGAPTQALIDSVLVHAAEARIIHYITSVELLSRPALLESMLVHMTDLRYQVTLLQTPEERALPLSWNLALWVSDSQTYIVLSDGARLTWHPVGPEAVQAVQAALDGLEQTPLYRYDTLETGSDYIHFTETAYQMEYNRRAVILKPTPGMQMLPADVVESTFRDFLSANFDAVVTSRETLIYTFEKRVKNFYQRKQPTTLLLSAQAMLSFARTGVMPDQFYAFRPYTKKERLRMLTALSSLAEKKAVTLRFLPGPGCPYSFEAYENQGVLIYPSDTCYNTRREQYRELFLPGQEAFALFDAYASELCRQASPPDTVAVFGDLIREAEKSASENEEK